MLRYILLLYIVINVIEASENVNILKNSLKYLREKKLPNHLEDLQKRNACDNGKGNYGINSFNFLAFVLLTFNVVANVNNNLNNNNNNKNDQNVNAISQNANNVATNTNVGNQIAVTVLPIPGKRSLDLWRSADLNHCRIENRVASLLFHRLTQLADRLQTDQSDQCKANHVCHSISQILEDLHFDDAVVMGLSQADKTPFLSIIGCPTLFKFCF